MFLEYLPNDMPGLRNVVVVRNADVDLKDLHHPVHNVVHKDYKQSSWVHPKMKAYSLAVKLDLMHESDINFIYSDDDVVCLKDPTYLGRFATGSHLDQLHYTNRDMTLCQMLSDCAEIDFTPLLPQVDAGIYYFPCDLHWKFRHMIYKFFDHKYFDLVYPKMKGNWPRTIDQRIMSAFFNAHGYNITKSCRDIRVVYSLQTNVPKKNHPTFYHYGCSSDKAAAAQMIRDKYVVATA